ncbi:uncharacterized protein LOC128198126 [Bicyclus anynana]|uniref:Uncharacterized protein LOC128198126 n=2 Tax=Bicyclus anynana TaxID=110368 RepID=A0ABM3LFI5_BICAN|nr:uncharacterized protein LOC128198126 [Bicyclus anynana]
MSTSTGNIGGGKQNVHLPKISLPVFGGNYEEFPSYKDLFLSLVHHNDSLSDVQKLHYLKTTVTGEAAMLLKNIQKLDPETHKQWEDFAHKDNIDELPTWKDLEKFLQNKFRTLELVAPTTSKVTKEKVQVNTKVTDNREHASTALLATATVKIMDDNGHYTIVRALVDTGSQASFVSERAIQLLKLKRTKVNGTITGIGSTHTNVKQSTQVNVLSTHDEGFKINIKTYIIPTHLITRLPTKTITNNTWPHIQGLVLADPSFTQPGRVDMLLGVDVCAQIMKSEIIKGPPGTPCAQNTSLGWILFGTVHDKIQEDEIISMHLNLDLDDMLKNMWEQERNETRLPTPEERKCEEIYNTTTTRTEEGRYIVKLPTKTEKLKCVEGNTRDIALKRLYQLEKRLEKDEKLKKEYIEIMEEYKTLNHMEEVPKEEMKVPAVYLPHHAVIKYEKETSKVRPVFNASQKGSNKVSLNDELLVGPQLQDDMRSLILRWRMKRVCFVADIQKMYRQILVTKEDSNLQRILWRSNQDEPVKDYRLGRVTFGTASAPYLAVRTLHQVATDEGYEHTDAAQVIKQDFYMDDLMSGKDNLQEAIKIAKDIDSILRRGGFIIQKWCSNNAEFLKQFELSQRSTKVNLEIHIDGSIRALGLNWNIGTDKFQYNLNLPALTDRITKRTILSDIQRLFDPLGWLAPSILPAKLLIQKLWLQGMAWDENVTEEIAQEWMDLRNSFLNLPGIEIDRWLQTSESLMKNVSVHGFCDASNRAYGAVAYMRVITVEGKVTITIIAAKSRVASTKAKSLPRLELNGAVLLAGLLKQIKEAMKIPTSQIYAWTDSTIVLSWLFGDPARWNIYVRNRVVEILEDIGNHNWYHVQSQDNPADLASRGMPLTSLKENKLWWNGPEWLHNKEIEYSRPKNISTNLERKEVIEVNSKIENGKASLISKIENCDDLTELLKVITYSKRFLKGKKLQDKDTVITTSELNDALKTCIKLTQQQSFKEDIHNIKTKGEVQAKSSLKSLNPYLDGDDVLRVGGRLRHASVNEDTRNPVILSHDTYLAKLLVDDAHLKTLHGGPQQMLGYLRLKYWILKSKNLVKLKFRKCLICAKQKAAVKSQLMGDLPRERVTPTRPFLNSSTDFAGPYQVLSSKGRGMRTTKAYVCIFVCMSTKAIHLELVGDMTSESFIGAMKRFTARRGKCAHMWSDQGRTFIGANKELAAAWAEAKLEFDGQIAESLALDGTQWHFIPAYSPHMGGLWEAGVKSMKYHLKRIMQSNLTYEEMSTLLCQIEACLNSRPLCPIEDDDDAPPLTPAHFLVGESLNTIPSPNLENISMTYLSRWQRLQKLLQDFWHRWQSEYLNRLQQRHKWCKRTRELDIGQIVTIKSDNLPPGKWMLGRITGKHPGNDGVTRVYSVKSGDNITKRSSNKLCLLPIDID